MRALQQEASHGFSPTRLRQLVEELATHHRRTLALVREICMELGIEPSCDLELAAALHDVGRLPLCTVIDPAAPLSPDDRPLVDEHPLLTAQILHSAGMYTAARIAMLHHERWDGQGYPHGLAGTRVPLPARILATADTLAAMIEPRAYRPTPDPVRELRRVSGTQLDPEIAEAAVRVAERVQDDPATLMRLRALHASGGG
jgi:HD-GYP domain-containing protein (c-di-GMP phosphodiesterase class II)